MKKHFIHIAIALEKNKHIIVAFRGTEPGVSDDWQDIRVDWLNNFDSYLAGISFQTPLAKEFTKELLE